ncbi:hypothetical protein ACFL0T_05440 [Candidatus Omnitrophota bacterium]
MHSRTLKALNKVALVCMIIAAFIFSSIDYSQAAWGKEKDPKKAAAKAAAEAAKKKEAARQVLIEKRRKDVREMRQKLNNTTWEIKLKESGQKENREQYTDFLRFQNGKVSADRLVDEGFAMSNFSVRIKNRKHDKKLVIWETMQSSADKGVTFWRGDLDKDEWVMRGVMSRHYDEENIVNFNYSGRIYVAPLPVVEPKEEAAVEGESAILAEVAAAPAEVEEVKKEIKKEAPKEEKKEVKKKAKKKKKKKRRMF